MKKLIFLCVLLTLLSLPVLAQTQTEAPKFDEAIVLSILAVAGIGVTGLTEMIKRLFNAKDLGAYIISGVVSAGATAFTLLQIHVFTILSLIIYTAIVFLEANGIYKFVKK